MRARRQRFFIVIIALGILMVSLSGCSKKQEQPQERKQEVKQVEPQPVDAATQEAFRKKIAELGIPMYKGAEFVEVKRKAKDSPLLVALYDAPAKNERAYDEVKSFYAARLKKSLGSKGWSVSPAADNMIMYRKGFEIIYVELIPVVVMPDMKKIRIAVHYGK